MKLSSLGLCIVLSLCVMVLSGCDSCCSPQAGSPESEQPAVTNEESSAPAKPAAESKEKMPFGEIEPKALHELQQKNKDLVIIDVRRPEEFATIHVPTAKLVPLDELDVEKVANEYKLRDAEFYLICRSGRRSATAAQKFVDAGIGKPFNVLGGTLRWHEEGLPVVEKGQMDGKPAK